MNVLLICRAKHNNAPSPIIQAQFNSLKDFLIPSLYPMQGRGWKIYINNIIKLKKFIKTSQPDLIHAHYSYVGMIASLATKKPVVVSLMGSDVEDYKIGRFLIRIFNRLSWRAVIVKSERLKNRIGLKNAHIIPNGVNLEVFRPIDRQKALAKTGFDPSKKHVLFLADPTRPEKNFQLAEKACREVQKDLDLALHVIHEMPHHDIPYYLAASDVLILTSLFEGSPNAIKEAMACNCPIVSTNVGDVNEIISETEGCYITSYEAVDVAEKLTLALSFGKRTNGRDNIQHLDDKVIAEKLLEVYRSVLV